MDARLSADFLNELDDICERAEAVLNEDVTGKLGGFGNFKKETMAEVEERLRRLKHEHSGENKAFDELVKINELLLKLIKYTL